MKSEDAQIHIDPGPGAIVNTHQEVDEPSETNAVIVSHAHLDHSNDAEATSSQGQSLPTKQC